MTGGNHPATYRHDRGAAVPAGLGERVVLGEDTQAVLVVAVGGVVAKRPEGHSLWAHRGRIGRPRRVIFRVVPAGAMVG